MAKKIGMTQAAPHLHLAVSTDEPRDRPKVRQQKGWRHTDAVTLLRDMILSGELAPGERLREIAISERLGMSRTPVREAFRTLAAEGLVALLPNRSVVVAELDETESVDVFSVLGTLEALAGQLACQRMTPDEIDALRRLQDDMERHFGRADRKSYIQANRAVHELMVQGAKNASLYLAWRMILPRAERARTLYTVDRDRWALAVEEHRKIFAALAARDGLLLSALMQDHFARGVIERMSAAKRKVRVKALSSNDAPQS
jgi:DNA-binding GntR family transcriptional regulator